MKYKNLISKYFTKSNNTDLTVAIVGGLAIGAVVSVLFAPNSGSGTRKSISTTAKNLGNDLMDAYYLLINKISGKEMQKNGAGNQSEVSQFTHTGGKKPKSNIKELVNEAHQQDKPHTEQSIS